MKENIIESSVQYFRCLSLSFCSLPSVFSPSLILDLLFLSKTNPHYFTDHRVCRETVGETCLTLVGKRSLSQLVSPLRFLLFHFFPPLFLPLPHSFPNGFSPSFFTFSCLDLPQLRSASFNVMQKSLSNLKLLLNRSLTQMHGIIPYSRLWLLRCCIVKCQPGLDSNRFQTAPSYKQSIRMTEAF